MTKGQQEIKDIKVEIERLRQASNKISRYRKELSEQLKIYLLKLKDEKND